MSGQVSEEAKEAAAKAICGPLGGWADKGQREAVERQALLVLEAALPALRAQFREELLGELQLLRGRLDGYADGLKLLPVNFGGKQELIDGLRADALKLSAALPSPDQEGS